MEAVFQRYEADNLPSAYAEVNVWNSISTPPYVSVPGA
jgi:hypothetical protein